MRKKIQFSEDEQITKGDAFSGDAAPIPRILINPLFSWSGKASEYIQHC
ncbi:hypothetical protein [Sphingobacterium sp.]|nr:hypothetical protein [Sphingobacterium sp.]